MFAPPTHKTAARKLGFVPRPKRSGNYALVLRHKQNDAGADANADTRQCGDTNTHQSKLINNKRTSWLVAKSTRRNCG